MDTIPHKVTGSGDHTVFWLHGWFGSSSAWGSMPRMLDGDRFRHIFVDYRGHGQRRTEGGDYTLDEIAADVLALAEDLGVDRFSLVGHSMGGAGALRVLSQAPDRVHRIVGIAPVGATPTPFDEPTRELFFGAPDDREKRYAIVDFTTGNRNTESWVNRTVAHSMEQSSTEAFRGHLKSWAEADFADDLTGVTVPALVIVGEHDRVLDEETVRQTWGAVLPDVRIAVMANAGHYPADETPVQTATVVERFLAEAD
ncbi:pimeloyl-ACP methyl ester carboxylesterase [Propionibacteriaceae bacterium ES.041]|uniref:alpha/beta fold hydrolase n=1 Tax=Enemella evansiae TaxID=2016499 RepID=UPI000B97C436|nr:alpha/beta hydrolase [Enemella evansiae]OYN97701.1 alpha/beta hydrolase [Enemella evansiae]OYO02181.1 alpha/beta hydrolase [Enemella evansiae]PFG65723.1 pimeloyl-ACP methyl ester carboxylesterase [Propionibacteriaceae bacterium ES.041]